jgi:foldase protein PrsA
MIISVTGCVKENKQSEAAIVNGEAITIEEFEEAFSIYKKMYEAQYGEDIWATEMEEGVTFENYLKSNILENMILEKMMLQEAVKNNISVSDEELEDIMKEYKDYFQDDAEYSNFLTTNGMTEAFLLNSMKTDETIQRYIDSYMNELEISDENLEKHYEENIEKFLTVRASHILVNSADEAEDILKQLKEGADFSDMAQQYSIDTYSAIEGGDLGFFGKGQMVAEFEEVAFSLGVGEISEVVPSTFGFHIIKLIEKSEGFEKNYDAVVADYKNVKYNDMIDTIESNSTVERKLKIN